MAPCSSRGITTNTSAAEHCWHSTFVNQVKRLLALSYWRFEAIRHKTHSKRPFKKPLVKGRKVNAPEIFKSESL
jgi:hypothetical protein